MADVDDRPIVIFRQDDCNGSWRTPFPELDGMNALQYGKLKRIPVTWAIISNLSTDNDVLGYALSYAELKDYLDTAGGEAASHSVTHTTLSSDQAYIDEVINSRVTIERKLPGYRCKTFIAPGTWHGNAMLDTFDKLANPIAQAIVANYSQSIAYMGNGWRVGNISQKFGLASDICIDYPTQSISQVMATLDLVAKCPRTIYSIACHGVQHSNGTNANEVRADIMRACMDKLAELRDAGKIRLMGMDEAYNTVFPLDTNRILDPDLEISKPESPPSIWTYQHDAAFVNNGGVGDSRYVRLPGAQAAMRNSLTFCLPAGRYLLSWHQKCEPGYPLSGRLYVLMWSLSPPRANLHHKNIDYALYSSSASNVWEKRSALVLVSERYPFSHFQFSPTYGACFGVDSISLVAAPIDPLVSASEASVVVSPGRCTVRWKTPQNTQVGSIAVRFNTSTHPLTPDSGTLLGTVEAIPGATQEMNLDLFDWLAHSNVYFSVFAINKDGSFSPPEIAKVHVDSTGPTTPVVYVNAVSARSVSASWISSDPESQIVNYRYGVGDSPESANIVNWTDTSICQAEVTELPLLDKLYFLVKAQNQFGRWSTQAARLFNCPVSIDEARRLSDGHTVAITGVVFAKYADCYYIAQRDRVPGIRVTGHTPGAIGSKVTVHGKMSTVAGERTVVPN